MTFGRPFNYPICNILLIKKHQCTVRKAKPQVLHQKDIVTTSFYCFEVVSTSIQHCSDVVCQLGNPCSKLQMTLSQHLKTTTSFESFNAFSSTHINSLSIYDINSELSQHTTLERRYNDVILTFWHWINVYRENSPVLTLSISISRL